MVEKKTIKSTCRLCYNSCGVLIDIEDNVPVAVRGDKAQALSKGYLCARGKSALDILNHPDRLTTPLLKQRKKSGSRWQAITWDDALDRIADGLGKIKDTYGPLSVVFARGGSKGMADDHLARFANQFGSPNLTGAAYICYSPSALASKHTCGFWPWPDLTHPSKTVVLWGFNPKVTHPSVFRELTIARKKGAQIILIDPAANSSTKHPDFWLRLKPGSDLALALGMIKIIIEEQLYDREFLQNWTIGFNRLKNHIATFNLKEIEALTWVDPVQLSAAVRLLCRQTPGCILWGNAIEATENSYQTGRAIAIIRGLTGNIGKPGTDIQWPGHSELRRRDPAFLLNSRITEAVRSQRLGSRAGLLPDFNFVPHHLVVKAILEEDPYPVKGMYLQNANVLVANEDTNRTRAALNRLDFCVATDMFMTPTAAMADVVLPSASFFEYDSVEQPWHSPVAFVQQKVATRGLAKSDGETLNALARRMGFASVWKNHEACLDCYLEPAGISFSNFREIGELCAPRQYRVHETENFSTPSGKVELYSSFLERLGFDPIPTLPHKLEEAEDAKKYPLILTNRKSRFFYHSSGRQISALRNRCPDPEMRIHPTTARHYGIQKGDWVLIRTRKGQIRQKAVFSEDLDQNVIMAEHGWWFPERGADRHFGDDTSNFNRLTDGGQNTCIEIGSSRLRGIPCQIEKESPS